MIKSRMSICVVSNVLIAIVLCSHSNTKEKVSKQATGDVSSGIIQLPRAAMHSDKKSSSYDKEISTPTNVR